MATTAKNPTELHEEGFYTTCAPTRAGWHVFARSTDTVTAGILHERCKREYGDAFTVNAVGETLIRG